jgi:hypothetical protein
VAAASKPSTRICKQASQAERCAHTSMAAARQRKTGGSGQPAPPQLDAAEPARAVPAVKSHTPGVLQAWNSIRRAAMLLLVAGMAWDHYVAPVQMLWYSGPGLSGRQPVQAGAVSPQQQAEVPPRIPAPPWGRNASSPASQWVKHASVLDEAVSLVASGPAVNQAVVNSGCRMSQHCVVTQSTSAGFDTGGVLCVF